MPKSNELETKKTTNIVVGSMYEEDAESGFEEADADAYAIPFLTILQALSPQCTPTKGEYIKEAMQGEIFNSVSEDRVSGEAGCELLPVHYKRAYIEWQPRDSGGGFVAEHSVADGQDLLDQSTKNDNGQDVLPNGNYLADTRSHYVLVLAKDGSTTPAVMTMTSTQMKKSRRWMSVMQNIKMERADGTQFTPPMFSHTYSVTTVAESNDKGSWYGWKITKAAQVTDANLYNAAKSFRDAVLSGEAKEAAPQKDDNGTGDTKEEF